MSPAVALAIVAVAADPATDGTALLLTYGPLGIFAVLAIFAGRVVWRRYNELLVAATQRAEAAEAKNDALVSRLMDQAALSLPVLTRVTDVTTRLIEELDRMRRDVR